MARNNLLYKKEIIDVQLVKGCFGQLFEVKLHYLEPTKAMASINFNFLCCNLRSENFNSLKNKNKERYNVQIEVDEDVK